MHKNKFLVFLCITLFNMSCVVVPIKKEQPENKISKEKKEKLDNLVKTGKMEGKGKGKGKGKGNGNLKFIGAYSNKLKKNNNLQIETINNLIDIWQLSYNGKITKEEAKSIYLDPYRLLNFSSTPLTLAFPQQFNSPVKVKIIEALDEDHYERTFDFKDGYINVSCNSIEKNYLSAEKIKKIEKQESIKKQEEEDKLKQKTDRLSKQLNNLESAKEQQEVQRKLEEVQGKLQKLEAAGYDKKNDRHSTDKHNILHDTLVAIPLSKGLRVKNEDEESYVKSYIGYLSGVNEINDKVVIDYLGTKEKPQQKLSEGIKKGFNIFSMSFSLDGNEIKTLYTDLGKQQSSASIDLENKDSAKINREREEKLVSEKDKYLMLLALPNQSVIKDKAPCQEVCLDGTQNCEFPERLSQEERIFFCEYDYTSRRWYIKKLKPANDRIYERLQVLAEKHPNLLLVSATTPFLSDNKQSKLGSRAYLIKENIEFYSIEAGEQKTNPNICNDKPKNIKGINDTLSKFLEKEGYYSNIANNATSFATPALAAILYNILSLSPNLKSPQIKDILQKSSNNYLKVKNLLAEMKKINEKREKLIKAHLDTTQLNEELKQLEEEKEKKIKAEKEGTYGYRINTKKAYEFVIGSLLANAHISDCKNEGSIKLDTNNIEQPKWVVDCSTNTNEEPINYAYPLSGFYTKNSITQYSKINEQGLLSISRTASGKNIPITRKKQDAKKIIFSDIKLTYDNNQHHVNINFTKQFIGNNGYKDVTNKYMIIDYSKEQPSLKVEYVIPSS